MKQLRKKITKDLREAGRAHLSDLSNKVKTNLKLVWKYVKRKTKAPGGIPDMNDDTKYLSHNTSKAECFNQYIQLVFSVSSAVQTTTYNTVALSEMAEY